jgi:hypothetical protein
LAVRDEALLGKIVGQISERLIESKIPITAEVDQIIRCVAIPLQSGLFVLIGNKI